MDEAKAGNDEVGISADLCEHIEAQLLSGHPIFKWGSTALHRVAQEGVEEVVALLLAACPFLINVPEQSSGWTAIHRAADAGHPTIVARLVAANPALIDARTKGGWTALHLAAENGAAAVVSQLLAINPASMDARTNDGKTVLHLAAQTGRMALVTQLLAVNPAAIEARANDGRNVLDYAACAGHQEVVTQLLAAYPALADARQISFAESITAAAQLLATKPTLIQAIINEEGSWAALLDVVKVDYQAAAVRVLAMRPELIHKTTSDGWTVFHQAASYGSNKVMWRLLATVPQPHLAPLLLRKSTDSGGETALHVAAKRLHSNIVAQLLAACPSLVDVLDHKGQTCLHSAISGDELHDKSMPTVEALLNFKPAFVHAVDARGNTILHLIRQRSSSEWIERVWKMNPDALRAVNRDGETPFHVAVKNLNENAIDLLQWGVTIDEIVSAYNTCGRSYVARFEPLMHLQCEELAMKLLPDVMVVVFEYAWVGKRPLRRKTMN